MLTHANLASNVVDAFSLVIGDRAARRSGPRGAPARAHLRTHQRLRTPLARCDDLPQPPHRGRCSATCATSVRSRCSASRASSSGCMRRYSIAPGARRGCGRASSPGRSGSAAATGARWAEGRTPRRRAAPRVRAGARPRLEEDPSAARLRPAALLRQRQRRAADGRRVRLRRRRDHDRGRVRAHGVLAGRDRQRRPEPAHRDGRPSDPERRGPDRRRRRARGARPQRHARATTTSPSESAAVLHDGWLATGDLATIDADGFVRIVDRKKEIFKTSGGKYVAPSRVEAAILRSPLVAQAVVIGTGRAHPAALIAPNWTALRTALALPGDAPSAELAARQRRPRDLDRRVRPRDRRAGDVRSRSGGSASSRTSSPSTPAS